MIQLNTRVLNIETGTVGAVKSISIDFNFPKMEIYTIENEISGELELVGIASDLILLEQCKLN
jgi:hypothetical protein